MPIPLSGIDSTLANLQPYVTHPLSLLVIFALANGVMIWRLSSLYDAAPEAVRKVVLAGVLAWFVTDSAGSIASGNASNALFNVAVLLLAVGPLWRPARG